MLYKIQEKTNQIINWLFRKKKYSLNNEEIGINLGSEIETIPQFAGIDGSFLVYIMRSKFVPKHIKTFLYKKTWTSKLLPFEVYMKRISSIRIIHHNLLYGIPFEDNSLHFIFTSHFLEHLTKEQTAEVLKESYRALVKHGKIRIIVPDLDEELNEIEKKIAKYRKNRIINPLQPYLTVEHTRDSEFGFHKRIYNFEELKNILEAAGFKNIKRMKRFMGDFPYLKKLEIRDGLIVEAEK